MQMINLDLAFSQTLIMTWSKFKKEGNPKVIRLTVVVVHACM